MRVYPSSLSPHPYGDLAVVDLGGAGIARLEAVAAGGEDDEGFCE
jgi:hypothetical protein